MRAKYRAAAAALAAALLTVADQAPAQQGSTRSLSMTEASITLTDGVPGFIAAATQRPFVTSFVPVVGGFGGGFMPILPQYGPAAFMPQYTPRPSVVQDRIARLRQQGVQLATSGRGPHYRRPARVEEKQPRDAQQARLAAAGESSAGQAATSVAAIRARVAKESEAQKREVAELERKIDEANLAGKPNLARIYQQRLERRKTGSAKVSKAATTASALRLSAPDR